MALSRIAREEWDRLFTVLDAVREYVDGRSDLDRLRAFMDERPPCPRPLTEPMVLADRLVWYGQAWAKDGVPADRIRELLARQVTGAREAGEPSWVS